MKLRKLNVEECHKNFGQFIKEARILKGYSQVEIAELTGITQSYYSRIETGDRDVDLALAIKICDALDFDINLFTKQYF